MNNMMEFLELITVNRILNAVFLGWFSAQLLKTIFNYALTKKWESERLIGSGGMPSSHSSVVCALSVATLRVCGFESVEFAIAVALASVVMYDAMNVRRAAGEQAKILNQLVEEWIDKINENLHLGTNKKLKELLGHTPYEVLGGALVGTIIGLLV